MNATQDDDVWPMMVVRCHPSDALFTVHGKCRRIAAAPFLTRTPRQTSPHRTRMQRCFVSARPYITRENSQSGIRNLETSQDLQGVPQTERRTSHRTTTSLAWSPMTGQITIHTRCNALSPTILSRDCSDSCDNLPSIERGHRSSLPSHESISSERRYSL